MSHSIHNITARDTRWDGQSSLRVPITEARLFSWSRRKQSNLKTQIQGLLESELAKPGNPWPPPVTRMQEKKKKRECG